MARTYVKSYIEEAIQHRQRGTRLPHHRQVRRVEQQIKEQLLELGYKPTNRQKVRANQNNYVIPETWDDINIGNIKHTHKNNMKSLFRLLGLWGFQKNGFDGYVYKNILVFFNKKEAIASYDGGNTFKEYKSAEILLKDIRKAL